MMEDGENGPKRLYNDQIGKNKSKNNEKYQNRPDLELLSIPKKCHPDHSSGN